MKTTRSLTSAQKASRPIGVFDSGLGGLSVVREIRRQLPHESVIYFGDLARLPYGTKSREQILQFSIQNTLFLLKRRVKAIVIACNSSASAAYPFLKNHFDLPVIDVIAPAVSEAANRSKAKRIGLIATQATVESGTYGKALGRAKPGVQIFSQACPMFVPLVEEGWLGGDITAKVIKKYLLKLKNQRIDTLILGCTHYPLLKSEIQKFMGPRISLIDSAKPTVKKLASLLKQSRLCYAGNRRGQLEIFISDKPRNFQKIGEKFLGEKLHHVKVVREKS